MSGTRPTLLCRESRAARRLSRLFRIERSGGFDGRPAAVIAKLIERRGGLIGAFMAMECERRSVTAQTSPALDQALLELASEIALSRSRTMARLQQIGKDLRLSRGEGLPSGIRSSTGGQSLGKI